MLSFLPKARIEKIELTDAADGGVNCLVTVVVEDEVKQRFVGDWVGTSKFLEFINLSISHYGNKPNLDLAAFGGENPQPAQVQVVNLSTLQRGSLASYKVNTPSGDLYRFSQNFSFKVPQDQMFSAFVAECTLNKQAIVGQLGIPEGDIEDVHGEKSVEVVFANGEVVSRSYAFLLPSGEQYIGPVHMRGDFVRSGAQETEGSQTLIVAPVHNYKIQDYRVFDFTSEPAKILSEEGQFGQISTIEIADKTIDIFSDLKLSLDDLGRVQMVASFDMRRAVLKATDSPFIFENMTDDEIADVVSSAAINSVTLTRRRVKGEAVSKQLRAERYLDQDEPEEIIAEAFVDRGRIANILDRGSVEVVDIYDGERKRADVAHIMAIDYDIADVTYGSYSYALNMAITDPTFEIVDGLVKKLREAEEFFKNLAADAGNPRYYDYRNSRFKGLYFDERADEDQLISEVRVHVASFLKAKRLYGSPSLKSVRVLRDASLALLSFLSPRVLSLETVDVFTRALSDMALSLSVRSGRQFRVEQVEASGGSLGGPLARSFEVLKRFNEYIDVDVTNKTAVRVVFPEPPKEDRGNGLREISLPNYLSRVSQETLKYYPSRDVNINIKTDKRSYTEDDTLEKRELTYLTPQVFKRGSQKFDASKIDNRKLESSTGIVRTLKGELRTDLQRERVVPEPTFETKGVRLIKAKARDSGEQLEADDQVARKVAYVDADISRAVVGRTTLVKEYSLKEPTNLLDEYQGDLALLPNQVKSLLLGSIEPEKVRVSLDTDKAQLKKPTAYDVFYLHYENISTVKVLTGYKSDPMGNPIMRAEVWENLTYPVLQRVAASSTRPRFLLCRLERFTAPSLKIGQGEPPLFYDGYFLINMEEAQDFVGEPSELQEAPPETGPAGETGVIGATGPRPDFSYLEPAEDDFNLQNLVTWNPDDITSEADTNIAVGAEVMKTFPRSSISNYPLSVRRDFKSVLQDR